MDKIGNMNNTVEVETQREGENAVARMACQQQFWPVNQPAHFVCVSAILGYFSVQPFPCRLVYRRPGNRGYVRIPMHILCTLEYNTYSGA